MISLKDTFKNDNRSNKSPCDSENFSITKTSHQTDNLKVVIRIRPALPRELDLDLPFRSIVYKILNFS